MAEAPRLYLVTPPVFEATLPDRVAALLDAFDVACLRLALAAVSEEEIARLMNELRQAMQQYMQALAEQMRQNPQQQQAMDPNARELTNDESMTSPT